MVRIVGRWYRGDWDGQSAAIMRPLICAVVTVAFIGSFVLPASGKGIPADCVDLLRDCNPDASSLGIVCGFNPHMLVPPVSNNISFVVFGPGVGSVTLVQCGTGLMTVLTGGTDLCSLNGDWNDNVCEILIHPIIPSPSLNPTGLSLLVLMLLAGGILALRRRVKSD